MSVVATCVDCEDTHPVADRPAHEDGPAATECPVCGALGYASEVTDSTVKSQAARIRDAVVDVHGVGEQSLRGILDEYNFYAELEVASVEELTEVPHVGEQTARRITEAV